MPAPSVEHAEWIVETLRAHEGVAFVVPASFDRCVRMHHALDGAIWADVAPEYLVRADDYEYPFPDLVLGAEGDMGDVVVDRMVSYLMEYLGGDVDCHFALWDGWGDLHAGTSAIAVAQGRGSVFGRAGPKRRARLVQREWDARAEPVYAFIDSCPTLQWWGGRAMRLFNGRLSAVQTIGGASPWGDGDVQRRGPQWWWPGDRSWFIATEIDNPWTYVAGPAELVIPMLSDDALETVEVAFTDRW